MARKDSVENRKRPYQLGLRVSDLANDLLSRIADKHGLSRTDAIEFIIRAQARAEGVWNITPTKN